MGARGPKGDKLITDALRVAMLRQAQDPRFKNRVHAMADTMAQRAEEGDMAAVIFVTERLEGKPTQTHAHGASEDLPPIDAIQVTFVRSTDPANDG